MSELLKVPRKSFTAKFTKGISALAGAVVLTGILAGCGGVTATELPPVTKDESDSNAVLQALNTAEIISLKKAAISLGDDWTVSADGEKLAELKGQFIPVLGDTYNMFSNNGNLVATEAEQTFKVMRAATLYDAQNEIRGEIQQKFDPFLSNYTIKDVDGNILGTAEQKFSLTLNFEIKNADGTVEYKVKKAALSLGASLEIERMVEVPAVDAQDAVWMAAIANEAAEAAAQN